MANRYTKKQTGAKINIDFSSFGGGKKPGKRQQKKAIKTAKSIGFGGILIVLLFLLIGAGVGVGAMFIVSKNDCFELNGSDNIYLAPDTTFVDPGCKIVAFGKDISDQVVVQTNLLKDDNGNYYATENGEYYVKYTTNDIKYGKLFVVEKYRIITVTDKASEEGELDEE